MKLNLQGIGKKIGGAAFRTLFPDVCLTCGALVSKQGVVCAQCWPELSFIERPFCEVTGAPFSVDFGIGAVSAGALANPPLYTAARSATVHGNSARKLVTRLKYGDRTDLAPWMADWMIRAGREFMSETDVIVPVPLHRMRYFTRRYNQAAELGRAIAVKKQLEFSPEILVRTKATKQQVGLNERQRQDNVRGAFKVLPDAEIKVAGRNILLIDDVLTTGATVNAAARQLFKAGASKVNVLTFSQVVPLHNEMQKLDMKNIKTR